MVEERSSSGEVAVNDARLYFDAAGTGPPLIFIHAGIADSRMWDDQMAFFADRFRAVRYDLRGFGRSTMSPSAFAHHDDLAMLLDYLGIERAAIVAASLGGSVAIDFTLAYPGRVSALVLVAPALSGHRPDDDLRQRWQAMEAAAERGDLQLINELELRLWVDGAGREPEDVDQRVRQRIRAMNAEVIAAEMRSGRGEHQSLSLPAVGRLGEITVPTLVVVGERDVPHFRRTAALIAAEVTGARLAEFAGVAHMLTMERPAEFNHLVSDFLSES